MNITPSIAKLWRICLVIAALILSACASTDNKSSASSGSNSSGFTGNGVKSAGASNGIASLAADVALKPITSSTTGARDIANLTPPADVWERIRRGYGMPNLESDIVRDREQWYATRPDYILRMTERSSKYLFHIVEELERRNMPTELALLPFIESAFNPQAISSAKAAGMWQFMPATGKHFSLKQNIFRDDRRDVLASTRAALDYLQKLYGMFGDWQLALAAYNWGEGSVSRALAKNRAAGLGLTYSDLNMPNETRYYVPKLQAVKNIISTPQSFNQALPNISNHPYFDSISITRDIDVQLAAKLAEINLEDFKALNPSASRPVILASGTPQILLPWDNATVFKRNLANFSGGQLATWTAWTAPTTMKVSAVASRVGMDENDLRSVNNIPPRMLITAGSTLLIPRSVKLQDDVAIHIADNAHMALSPEIVLQRTVVKAKKKDSVALLARRYNVSPSNIAEWNKISVSASLSNKQSVILYLPMTARMAGKVHGRSQSRLAVRSKSSVVKVAARTSGR
ncbi:MAG: transglycosylase SLT domain-containing protein [Burkholderiaceae bacterium]|nr:transglycosylase SLT domain-containing protein [Burkholderiaceae bacterium]